MNPNSAAGATPKDVCTYEGNMYLAYHPPHILLARLKIEQMRTNRASAEEIVDAVDLILKRYLEQLEIMPMYVRLPDEADEAR